MPSRKRGKQFYFYYGIVVSHNTVKYGINIIRWGYLNREAIEGFCPVGSTGQKNLKSASVCGRLRLKKNQMIKDNLRIL